MRWDSAPGEAAVSAANGSFFRATALKSPCESLERRRLKIRFSRLGSSGGGGGWFVGAFSASAADAPNDLRPPNPNDLRPDKPLGLASPLPMILAGEGG